MSPSLLPIGDLTTKDAAFSLIQSTDQPLPFSSSNSPFGFAISPNGMNVYVGGSEGGLVWFQRNVDDGTLTYAKAWLPTDDLASALDSVEEVAISSDGQYVVAAGSDGSLYGSMGVFRAQDNGDLTLLHGGTFPEVQRVLFPPDSSTHFYTIDSSTKSVKQWRYDGTQDEFAQVGAGWTMTVNPDDAQDGYVDSISISPDGKNVYVHDASRSQSFNFKRNLDNGSLELVDVLKGDPSSTGDGLKCITDMEFSGDGTRAIAIEGCDNTLALFGRDLGTGTLSVLSVSTPVNPTGNPLALSAAFNFIIAEDDSGEIDAYIIDSGDSMLGWFRRTVYEDGTEALVLQKWFPLDPNSHYIQIDGSLTDIYTTSGGGNGVNEPWTAQHFVRSTYVADAAVDPPAQASSSGKGLSRGAAVGIGVSVAFFFMCVTVAAIYFLRRRIKKLEAQEGHYLEMLDKKPNDATLHNNYGHFLQNQRKDYDAAEREFREAIRLAPNRAFGHNSLGYLLQHYRKNIDGAEVEFREAVRCDPKNTAVHYNLGYLLQHERGNAEEAEKEYREAIRHDKKNGLAHYNLGFLLEKEKKDLDAAAACYREALECDSDDADAARRLKRLEDQRAKREVEEAKAKSKLLGATDKEGADNKV